MLWVEPPKELDDRSRLRITSHHYRRGQYMYEIQASYGRVFNLHENTSNRHEKRSNGHRSSQKQLFLTVNCTERTHGPHSTTEISSVENGRAPTEKQGRSGQEYDDSIQRRRLHPTPPRGTWWGTGGSGTSIQVRKCTRRSIYEKISDRGRDSDLCQDPGSCDSCVSDSLIARECA